MLTVASMELMFGCSGDFAKIRKIHPGCQSKRNGRHARFTVAACLGVFSRLLACFGSSCSCRGNISENSSMAARVHLCLDDHMLPVPHSNLVLKAHVDQGYHLRNRRHYLHHRYGDRRIETKQWQHGMPRQLIVRRRHARAGKPN